MLTAASIVALLAGLAGCQTAPDSSSNDSGPSLATNNPFASPSPSQPHHRNRFSR
jgi:hypothetical protein